MIGDAITQAGEAMDPTTGRAHDTRAVDTEPARVVATATTLGSETALPRSRAVPARVGRYIVLDGLGAGGMGVIHAAYDPELDRRVAIKLLRAGPGAESSGRLLREAQALARLSHPNVVQIHDTGVQDEQVFLAMELVEGVNLRGWLDAEPRPWRTIVRVFVEAGRGLAAAHAAGIVHRDFKPENVLVGTDGRARVADFGLARQVAEDAAAGTERAAVASVLAVSLTVSGTILGTPAYMSPEQFAGAVAGPRSDLFSFCVALHEALYRVRPFAGEDLPSLVGNMIAGRLREPPAGSPVPRHVLALLRRGLAHDPEARPASMEALLAGLTFDPGARRRRWGLALGLAAATSGATAALMLAAPAGASVCEDVAGLTELWSAESRARVTTAIDAAGATSATREHVVAGVDAYAAAWQAARRGACDDHHRGGESEAVFAARTRCLDRRLRALDGALRLLAAARVGDDVARVIAGLPAIDACARIDELLAAPARDLEVAAVVEPRIDEGRALADAGRFAEAGAAISIAIAAAQAAGDRVLLAQARLADGRREMMQGTWKPAATALRLALAEAIAGRDDATAAEAVARLLYARARSDEEVPAKILEDAPLARAIVERVGVDGFARRRLLADLGFVHLFAGDAAAARAHLTAATDGLAAVVDADPLEAANFLQGLATLTEDPRQRADAYAQAEAMLVRSLGEDHPDLLDLRLNRGRTAVDLAEGRAQIASACAGTRRLFPTPDPGSDRPSCRECGLRLGGLARAAGDDADALRWFDEAATCDGGAPREPDHGANLESQRALAQALAAQLRGEADAAVAAAERVIAALVGYGPDRWWLEGRRADAWQVIGEVQLVRGERAAARTSLERAHAARATVLPRLPEQLLRHRHAEVAARLGELLASEAGERARGRALVEEARRFHAGRGATERVAALDEWLAAHP